MSSEENLYKRRQTEGLVFREGPSSIDDELTIAGNMTRPDDSPKGLDEYLPHCPEKVADINDLAGSEVLIVYVAKLGQMQGSTMDLNYLETLIKTGANVNYTDAHGQSVLHEVALRWPIEVAEFLYDHGAELNRCDNFGRTPLHVAASVDHPDMVKWLCNNGADIHARTKKEQQTPIHYAAKYNAVEALNMLIKTEARLDDRDHKERTPLHLAAETGREAACRVLMSHGAPAGVYDDTGTSCLTQMIEKMPDVAALALDQFQKIDKSSRTVYFYLSYLETQKWKNMRINDIKGSRMLSRMEPLEAIIKYNESRLIMHPVIQRLLAKKVQLYGKRHFMTNLFVNFIFTAIWTALTVTLPGPEQVEAAINTQRPCPIGSEHLCRLEFYMPVSSNIWRIVLEAIGLLMVVYFILKIRIESGLAVRDFHAYKLSRGQELKRDLPYCHPRWPQEGKFVKEEIRKVESERVATLYDIWYYLDVLSFLGLVLLTITRLLLVQLDFNSLGYIDVIKVHYHAYPFVLIVIWLRFMQAFRPFITLGPFIAMLGYVATDTLKFGFLFCEFYIPYCCSIWIVFGGTPESGAFQNFNDLLFEVYRMTVVDSFEYADLTDQNKLVAQLICGTYLAITSITCLNLYIALLSETFSRVFGNATATAYMLQGEALINVEKKMPNNRQEGVQTYIAEKCSPEAVYGATEAEDDSNSAIRDIVSEMDSLQRQFDMMKKFHIELKVTSEFFKLQAVSTMNQQNELMQDISDSLKEMTDDA